MLRPPRAQTAYAKGHRGQLPSLAGLGNQGLVQQGQPEVRGIPKHTVTYIIFISISEMLKGMIPYMLVRVEKEQYEKVFSNP